MSQAAFDLVCFGTEHEQPPSGGPPLPPPFVAPARPAPPDPPTAPPARPPPEAPAVVKNSQAIVIANGRHRQIIDAKIT
jgi:hypothetical protein